MFPTMMPDVADASSAERPDQEAELSQRAYTRNCHAPLLVCLSRLHIGLMGLQSPPRYRCNPYFVQLHLEPSSSKYRYPRTYLVHLPLLLDTRIPGITHSTSLIVLFTLYYLSFFRSIRIFRIHVSYNAHTIRPHPCTAPHLSDTHLHPPSATHTKRLHTTR